MIDFSVIRPQSILGRALRAPLRLLPPDARVPILQGRLRGKKWIVGSSIHGCWLGGYEREQQRVLVRLIAPGSVVFDVGANVGFYTLLASELVGPEGRVFAFEPFPRNIEFLTAHLQANAIRNARLMPVAVGDRDDDVRFEEGENHARGSVSNKGTINVRMRSLDSLIEAGELPVPAVIKMDIEGGEVAAIAGLTRTLRQHRPKLLISTHGQSIHETCLARLQALGYDFPDLTADGVGNDVILAV